MGCIEICLVYPVLTLRSRLIETWDVLKCVYSESVKNGMKRLIETWDVLKYDEIGECII